MKEEPKTWSDVWFHHVRNGKPYEEAAFRADEWERRQKALAKADRSYQSEMSRLHGPDLTRER